MLTKKKKKSRDRTVFNTSRRKEGSTKNRQGNQKGRLQPKIEGKETKNTQREVERKIGRPNSGYKRSGWIAGKKGVKGGTIRNQEISLPTKKEVKKTPQIECKLPKISQNKRKNQRLPIASKKKNPPGRNPPIDVPSATQAWPSKKNRLRGGTFLRRQPQQGVTREPR